MTNSLTQRFRGRLAGLVLLGVLGFAASMAGAASNPYEITDRMMPGWNLGNALDAPTETAWGNPVTTRAMIDAVRAAGFKTLRVPVSWDGFTSGANNTIAPSRLDRVAQVVQYGLDNGLYVIVNVHHSGRWQQTTYANEAAATRRLNDLWRQIATRLRSLDGDKLIFEVMNEPRADHPDLTWWGTPEFMDVVNKLNAAALSTIRATGGNNASRLVMLPTYAAAGYDHQLNAFVKPNDRMVALSVHAYLPQPFGLHYPGTATFTDTGAIDSLFARLNTKFHSRGTPVVIGEWGSTHKNNLSERSRHAEYYVRTARNYGIPVIVWDNGVFGAGGEVYGLLNRSQRTWAYPDLITSIMRGASGSGSTSSAASSRASSRSSAVSSRASSSRASSSAASSSAASSSSNTRPVLRGTGDYPEGFTKCADSGGTCVVPSGSGWVVFGRKTKWILKYVGVGRSTPCTMAAFGNDPGGNPNKCSYQR